VAHQKPSIISICAAHLEGKDLVVQDELVLKPYVDGAACEDKPNHSEGTCNWFARLEVNIVATVENKHPEERGRMRVSLAMYASSFVCVG
jgi:hypothetical protein